jgi:hypothetical protein
MADWCYCHYYCSHVHSNIHSLRNYAWCWLYVDGSTAQRCFAHGYRRYFVASNNGRVCPAHLSVILGWSDNRYTTSSSYSFYQYGFYANICFKFLCITMNIGMYFYYLNTVTNARTAEEWAIIYFILSLTNNLCYVNKVKSFYLSTLTSRVFRQTFKSALLKLFSRNLPMSHPIQQVN